MNVNNYNVKIPKLQPAIDADKKEKAKDGKDVIYHELGHYTVKDENSEQELLNGLTCMAKNNHIYHELGHFKN